MYDKDKRIKYLEKTVAESEKELTRIRKDRDKYIKWIADLRGSLNKITSIADDRKNWK